MVDVIITGIFFSFFIFAFVISHYLLKKYENDRGVKLDDKDDL